MMKIRVFLLTTAWLLGPAVAAAVADPRAAPAASATPTTPAETPRQLKGRLVDERGQGIPGGLLTWMLRSQVVEAAAGADGAFDIAAPPSSPAEPLRLLAKAPLFAADERILVGPGDVELGAWVLRPEVARSGKVVDTDDQPIVGAAIHLRGAFGGAKGGGRRAPEPGKPWTISDDFGRFALNNLPRGSLQIEVLADGFLPATVALRGDDPRGLEVELRRGVWVSGRVFREGRPAAEARVDLASLTTRTDAEGRFSLGPLASRRGLKIVSRDQDDWQAGPLPLSIPAAGLEDLELHLQGFGEVLARVLAADGRPAHGVVVTVTDGRRLEARTTDEEGLAAFGKVRLGRARLEARDPELGRARLDLDVVEGEIETELQLSGEPKAELTLRVLTADDEPIAGAAIVLAAGEPSGGEVAFAELRTDQDGLAELAGAKPGQELYAGKVVGVVSHPDFVETEFKLRLAGGDNGTRDIRLKPGAFLRGRIENLPADGRPIFLRLVSERGRLATVQLDRETGEFLSDALKAGVWHLRIWSSSFEVIERRVRIGGPAGSNQPSVRRLDLDWAEAAP